MRLCYVCGNEFHNSACCPFCGSNSFEDENNHRIDFAHKTINLEKGRPKVEIAINKMKSEIRTARINNINCLTFIHGYGSSGKGGAIKEECRKILSFLMDRGEIKDVISGEDFSSRRGLVKNLLRRYPQLESNKNLNKNNPGVTIIVL